MHFRDKREILLAVTALLAGLCMTAQAAGVKTDAVNELTPDAGVTVDGVAIKDGKASGTSTETDDADGTLTTKDYVAIPRVGSANVVVQTTDDPAANAAMLRAAYTAAKLLTPNGGALAANNRAVVLVSPGAYDLGASTFTLDADYVDLEGLSTAREDQRIFRNGQVFKQTASDVRIENLLFHYTGTFTSVYAYYPDATWVATGEGEGEGEGTEHTGSPPATVIRNCEFRVNDTSCKSMRHIVEYAGTYADCLGGGLYAFGGPNGTASGTFNNCTGGDSAFGGTASGTFNNCTGGDSAFGGTASGTFNNCIGGEYAFGGRYGTASGTFNICIGGDSAFGGFGTASGTFTNCTGGEYAFGGSNAGTASGTFNNCIGGDYAFGGFGSAENGKFFHCFGGYYSFTESGTPAPHHHVCFKEGALYSGND